MEIGPAKALATCLCIFLLVASSYASGSQRTIYLRNHCSFNVWPAISTWNYLSKPYIRAKETPQMLKPGDSQSLKLNPSWSGTIWGRIACHFDSKGIGYCESGDCGGKLRCDSSGSGEAMPMAVTTASFDNSSFQVSLEYGYNLPMSVIPSGKKNKRCESMICSADVKKVCPKKLQVLIQGNKVVGCKGQCDSLTLRCSPPWFAPAFHRSCPRAFPFHQAVDLCPSPETSYTLTFCADS